MQATESIKTKDGMMIRLNLYSPGNGSRGVIVLSPSADLTQEAYYDAACYFREQGYEVVSFDYRGVGDSKLQSRKRYKANLTQWAMQDLDAVLRFVKNHYPKQEINFIGHGIGGEIVGLVPASQFIDRIILINAALSCSRLRSWNRKLWIGSLHLFISSVSWLFGYFPGKKFGILNDLPKGVVDEWITWCKNPNGLFDDFSDHNYRKLQVPLLAINFSDDWRSRKKGIKALLEHFTSACVSWHQLRPGHLGVRRVGHSRFLQGEASNRFLPLLAGWLNNGKLSSPSQTHKE